MRNARPAFAAIFAEARKAIAFAALFSFGAGLLALALPFAVMHAIDAAERRASLDALAIVILFAVAAAALRAALLSSRDRILLQAALWLGHTGGSAVLTDRLNRGVMPEALDADRAALERCTAAISGPAAPAVFDALAAVVPLAVLFLVHPALGFISLLVVACVVVAALARARAAAAAESKAQAAYVAADKAWRTAAANGPMIAMRHMASGVVADWETLSRAAVVAAYGLARPARRAATALRAVDVGSCLLIAGTGVSLVLADSLTLAGLAAAVVLHVLLTRAVLDAHDHIPELAGLEAALDHLAAEPTAMSNRPIPVDAPAVGSQAVGGLQPTGVMRPQFDQAPPLPMARPPAAYGTVQQNRGGY